MPQGGKADDLPVCGAVANKNKVSHPFLFEPNKQQQKNILKPKDLWPPKLSNGIQMLIKNGK